MSKFLSGKATAKLGNVKSTLGGAGATGRLSGGPGTLGIGKGKAKQPEPESDQTLEEHAAEVLTEAEAGFRDRARNETDRFFLATDTEYWFATCFQSRSQKDQFLAALREKFGLKDDGDKYIDGWMLAKALGIELDRVEVPYNTSSKLDKTWLGLAR